MEEHDSSFLPPHVKETVRAIRELHENHHSSTSLAERFAACVTGIIARPLFAGFLTLAIAGWIVLNIVLRHRGLPFYDAPPFPWLEDGLTLLALYMALLILITQRRADMIATHREQMTLQLGFLSEQKAGKIISLLEEARRESPYLQDRHDSEAEAMSAPVDAHVVSKALEKIGPDDGSPRVPPAKPAASEKVKDR
jgi:uncharacterized membrane protein